MKHQPGEFPVQFLGSHDYYWIHRGRVFSYQEGDKGSIGSGGKYLAEIFKKGLYSSITSLICINYCKYGWFVSDALTFKQLQYLPFIRQLIQLSKKAMRVRVHTQESHIL